MNRTYDLTDSVLRLGAVKGIAVIKANPDNAGVAWIGYENDVANGDGFPLSAGEEIILRRDYDVGNFRQQIVYAVSDQATGDKLHVLTIEG